MNTTMFVEGSVRSFLSCLRNLPVAVSILQIVYSVALPLLATTMYAYECFITVFISAHHSVVSTYVRD